MLYVSLRFINLYRAVFNILFVICRLPVLAGPAGALGASYNAPYLSVDGGFHARPSGQVPSLAGASRLAV